METEYYSFFYCMMHDDGFIINENHDYVPEGYIMQHSEDCESCDWYNMGIIISNGISIEIIESVRLNYDKYAGGFEFRGYTDTLTNEKGEDIDMDKNSVLYKWIDEIANNTSDFIE